MPRTSINIATTQPKEIINVTHKIESWLRHASLKEGILIITIPHSTAAVILNEDEDGLKKDILSVSKFFDFIGAQTGGFAHNRIDSNASAHLSSIFFGPEITLPVSGGHLVKGQWQEILFVELDGPRDSRQINLNFIPSN